MTSTFSKVRVHQLSGHRRKFLSFPHSQIYHLEFNPDNHASYMTVDYTRSPLKCGSIHSSFCLGSRPRTLHR